MKTLNIMVIFAIFLFYSYFKTSSTTANECDFPAIFNFGDSNSDTGGLASAFPAYLFPPYGETYFHEPAGRFSDGRLIIDFIAKSFGLPYLNAYLDSLGTEFKQGANFATAASTIRLPNQIIPGGEIHAKLMSREEYFKRALYTFDIGQNDLGEGFFSNKSLQEVNQSVPDIVNSFSTNFKNIYNISGGRSFWIHNTGPIGCLPYIFANFPSAERDEAGCAKPFNEVAKYFNDELKSAVAKLRTDFPSAAIIYVDVYTVKYSLFTDPQRYGFELPLVACCGYGGSYNYSASVGCGGTITVNGTQIFVGSCGQASVRVNWDGIHYTEAANKFIFDKISTGAFSDPPIPLRNACFTSP
ncbi:hypothetical protein TIFTF001_020942 [Ficus carica]|uniref:Uncharacterized protein n=1 Tax=Ficus carica TaxID=3494 RepID=A0AA88AER7_FICCA|nr:hypothetical protein TIFTF001_020942 [Ficus carica]